MGCELIAVRLRASSKLPLSPQEWKRLYAEKTTAYRDVVSTACHWYVKGLDKHWVKLAETDTAIANDEACAAGRKTARLFADQHAGAADDLSEADFGPPTKRAKAPASNAAGMAGRSTALVPRDTSANRRNTGARTTARAAPASRTTTSTRVCSTTHTSSRKESSTPLCPTKSPNA